MEKKLIQRHLDRMEIIIPGIPKNPNMPVETLVQEAMNLFQWMQHDKQALIAAGLNWDRAMELEERANFCSYTQAKWMEDKKLQKPAHREWLEKAPQAVQFRSDLISNFRYAFRSYPDLLKMIRSARDSRKMTSLIQDLVNLAIIGDHHRDLLNAINFDFRLLQRAEEIADEMADLIARRNAEQKGEKEAKNNRDKAFFYLKELLDEVRSCGRFVFRNDPERFAGYINGYRNKPTFQKKIINRETAP